MKSPFLRLRPLFSQVAALNEKHEEIARITGRKFNIFSILGAETKETSTHSAFLVELLNPKGDHGQKGLFLQLFIDMLRDENREYKIPVARVPEIPDVDVATVEKEKYLGPIRNEKTEGGLADIVINHFSKAICIENKIYADDQEKQLIRYHNYYLNNERGGILLYLTLYGNSPSPISTHSEKPELTLKENKDYFIISYKRDILNWLLKCQSAVVDVPIVRDAIGQYIFLIKKLTGQGMSRQEEKQAIDLITTFGKKYGENDLVAIRRIFDVFLAEIGSKLIKLQGKLKLGNELIRKPTEVWSKHDQHSKLNSVLFIPLKPLPNSVKKDLKIRLSPKGWTFELWHGREMESVLRVIDYDTFTIDQMAEEVTQVVKAQVQV